MSAAAVATMTDVEEDLVPRREAARLAGVHVNTVRLWEDHGRVHVVKLDNGRVMIPRADVEAIVAERTTPSGDDLALRLSACEAENRLLRDQLDVTREDYSRLQRQHEMLLDALVRSRGLARGEGDPQE